MTFLGSHADPRRLTLRSRARERASTLAPLPRWRAVLLSSLALACACASRSLPVSYPAHAASSAQAPEAAPANVLLALSGEPPFEGPAAAGEPAHSEPPAPAIDHSQHQGGHHHGAH